MRKFYTKFDCPVFTGVERSDFQEDGFDTQRVGYVSMEKQISAIMMAGMNLQEYNLKNSRNYTFPDGIDDGRPVDPTLLGSNYDLADASKDIAYLQRQAKLVQSEKQPNADATNIVMPTEGNPVTE